MNLASLNGRPTTQLGFGCSLLGSTSPSKSRRLLLAAYDAGIRHFDVAPMYGFGKAETMLSQALGTHIQDVTITTKYGLAPPPNSSWIAPLHRLARSALRHIPAVRRRIQSFRQSSAPDEALLPLTGAAARRSLTASLRNLRLSVIDLFLLHEAVPERLTDAALLDMLEEEKSSGRIREFGIGSTRARVEHCLTHSPAFCHVLQFEWSAFSPVLTFPPDQQIIRHGSLASHRLDFTGWLLSQPGRTIAWSEDLNRDLRQPGIIERLLLKSALVDNPAQIVLTSTRTISRIFENVQTAEDPTLEQPAKRLRALILAEYLASSSLSPSHV